MDWRKQARLGNIEALKLELSSSERAISEARQNEDRLRKQYEREGEKLSQIGRGRLTESGFGTYCEQGDHADPRVPYPIAERHIRNQQLYIARLIREQITACRGLETERDEIEKRLKKAYRSI